MVDGFFVASGLVGLNAFYELVAGLELGATCNVCKKNECCCADCDACAKFHEKTFSFTVSLAPPRQLSFRFIPDVMLAH